MSNNNSDPNALVDKFTQILAYIGDEEAKDGYNLRNKGSDILTYSVPIRPQPISEKRIKNLVKQIKLLLMNNKSIKGFDQDIIDKTNELKTLYDATHDQSTKDELIEYISDFESNSGMHGGKGKRSTRRRKTKSNRRKSLKTHKK